MGWGEASITLGSGASALLVAGTSAWVAVAAHACNGMVEPLPSSANPFAVCGLPSPTASGRSCSSSHPAPYFSVTAPLSGEYNAANRR